MLAASPFSDESHTGPAIEKKTEEALERGGISGLQHETLFFPVSDNAANMILGWAPYGRGPCVVHTMQLSVHVFLEHDGVKPTRDKQKGIVAHFNKSTGVDGLNGLHKCQRSSGLPQHHPVSAVETRWSSDHGQMDWFRYEQPAVQLYDVQHSRKAGDAYKQHQLGLEDWTINEQGVAVLQPFADWTQHMQGTKYPTLPLVLPTTYALIADINPQAQLDLSFPGVAAYSLQPNEIHKGVLAARTALYTDTLRRFVTDIDPAHKRVYAIATLLHPCFKDYSFIDAYDFIDVSDKAWALQELSSEWKFQWKPKPKPPSAAGSSADPPAAADPPVAADSPGPPTVTSQSPTRTSPRRPPAAAAPPPEPAPEPVKKARKVTVGVPAQGQGKGGAAGHKGAASSQG